MKWHRLFGSKLPLIIMAISFTQIATGQIEEQEVLLKTTTGNIAGTLLVQDDLNCVVLMVSGSGPTDRNGNNPSMKNNSLKMVAENLYERGIASLRFDKRGLAASSEANIPEDDLRIETFSSDIEGWIKYLKTTLPGIKIPVLGHSLGSLQSIIALQDEPVDYFISIAGPGRKGDIIIEEQLQRQPPFVLEACKPILDSLRTGKIYTDVDPMLLGLFRPSIQPYLISLFSYDPVAEIATLEIPVLVIGGDNDVQVPPKDAQLLSDAAKKGQLAIIPGMNHVLKNAPEDYGENLATYNDPDLALSEGLVDIIVEFLMNVKLQIKVDHSG